MIALDSALPPTPAQAQAAKAGDIGLWCGYLTSWRTPTGANNVGLFHSWSQADFDVVKIFGTPVAFCSGWDSPTACRALAAQWGVRLCLDVEARIRGDGSWVQPWLDASGAGLYGLLAVHDGRRAPFHIAANYQPNPGEATWPTWSARPNAPCGWQFWNTHNEFGVGVDRSYFDPWFAGSLNGNAASEIVVGGIMATTDDIMKWIGENGDPLLRHISGDTDATAKVVESLNAWIDQNGNPLLRDIDGKVGSLQASVDALTALIKAQPVAGKTITGTITGEIK